MLFVFLLFFISSSEVLSLPFRVPLFSPLYSSCSTSPPQTSVCVTGKRTVTVPRRSSPSLFPSHFFLSSFFHLCFSFTYLPPLPTPASSISTLFWQPLFLFSLRLSPFTAPLFFIYISLHPNLCQAVPPPLSPLICSSFSLFFFSHLSFPLQSVTTSAHLTSLCLCLFVCSSTYSCPLFLLWPLTLSCSAQSSLVSLLF